MLEARRSQKKIRRRTRWLMWWKKRTKTQVESKLLTMTKKNEYNIPNDIIIEILSRLPGKSLLKFRWACKYWFDLITKDPSFAKLQLMNHAINNPLLMFFSSSNKNKNSSLVPGSLNCRKLVELDDDDDDESSSSSSLSHYSLFPTVTRILINTHPINIGTVVGTCNGLLCIRNQEWGARYGEVIRSSFCIWNPCTHEFKESCIEPSIEPIVVSPEEELNQYYSYGFGYDQTNDDYKVLSYTMLYDGHHCESTVVQVYTLGTNSWKRIENCYPFRLCCKIRFIPNGASFYFLGNKSPLGYDSNVILCFDIAKEEFREISMPWFVADKDHVNLIELNGCLCIAQYASLPSERVEVWMAKIYCHDDRNKNDYSWTKLYTIREPEIFACGFKSLGIFNKNGDEILIQLMLPDVLCWYNVKDDTIHETRFLKSRSLKFCNGSHKKVKAYVESLLSLNSGTYMGHEEDEENNNKKNASRTNSSTKYIEKKK